MEHSAPICPTVAKAMFIGSSKYLDQSKALPQANKDVRAVKKFFEEHIEAFEDPSVLIDKRAE